MPLTTVSPALLDSTAQYYGFKNRIINGDMRIDQRNNGAISSAIPNSYNLDRWFVLQNVAGKFRVQQNAGAITPPVGFSNYLGITSLSAYPVQIGGANTIAQRIEGLNVADLAWGTANAAPVTLSFLVYSSLTGSFGGSITNAAQDRSYPFSYSIPVANTWTTISLTIPGDTTGTWLTTNGIGLTVFFGIGVGVSLVNTAGAWTAGNFLSATGSVSVVGTNGATLYITGVQLEKGTAATSFDVIDYGRQLLQCQRYYAKTFPQTTAVAQNSGVALNTLSAIPTTTNGGVFQQCWQYPTVMRAAPTVTTYNPAAADANWRNISSGVNYTASIHNVSDRSAWIRIAVTVVALQEYLIHADANAEL